MFVRSFKDYEFHERDILKIGRVKFAVKEIGYVQQTAPEAATNEQEAKFEKGHSSNSVFDNSKDEDFEEFTEVPAILSETEESKGKPRDAGAASAGRAKPTKKIRS